MSRQLQVGEIGVLQHLNRQALNGLIAEVTGELKMRMLYSLSNPADSEICLAYKVRVPGYPAIDEKIAWCVKVHQLRAIDGLDDTQVMEQIHAEDWGQALHLYPTTKAFPPHCSCASCAHSISTSMYVSMAVVVNLE